MKQAEAEAEAAIAEARNKLEVNYLAGLGIAKEPYELARENLLQSSAAALQAGMEGETRGAAATAGQVLMAQQAQAAQQRSAMSQDMQRLQELAAREDICRAPAGALQISSGAAPSLGTFSGTDYSTFGQDLINFQPIMPNLTNNPFYQFMQPGVTAPKLP